MWFAFKFVFLYWLIQLGFSRPPSSSCCDLLSNLYFCIGWYSRYADKLTPPEVVICFQICIFVLVDTALFKIKQFRHKLWFAFKFVFLYWLIQRMPSASKVALSCDLLSNLYFCIGWYSRESIGATQDLVVICFQICIFVLVDTAFAKFLSFADWLWFAFKFVFLYWLIQLTKLQASYHLCCDLLSNLYFCIGWYSPRHFRCAALQVVICFQICIFVLVDTAHH